MGNRASREGPAGPPGDHHEGDRPPASSAVTASTGIASQTEGRAAGPGGGRSPVEDSAGSNTRLGLLSGRCAFDGAPARVKSPAYPVLLERPRQTTRPGTVVTLGRYRGISADPIPHALAHSIRASARTPLSPTGSRRVWVLAAGVSRPPASGSDLRNGGPHVPSCQETSGARTPGDTAWGARSAHC